MSAAGRPTWTPAIAKPIATGFTSKQYSSKDLKSHTKLKYRQPGQGTKEEIEKRDLRRELEEREKKHFKKDDEIEDEESEEDEEPQKLIVSREDSEKSQATISKSIDADDSDEDDDDDDSDSDENDKRSSDSDDEDDDTAELLKELEKIKREREEEAARKEMEALAQQAADREQQVLLGNPLINASGEGSGEQQDYTIKKRWYDDTIFKNQAKGEVKQQKRFINDTIRNDFHKKFLTKYIQ